MQSHPRDIRLDLGNLDPIVGVDRRLRCARHIRSAMRATLGQNVALVRRIRMQGSEQAVLAHHASHTAVWNDVPVQRCTVHKHRNLLACAPERLHDEITADYTDMIYAATPQDIADRRKAFIRKWRLRHKAVADSLRKPEMRCSHSPRCHHRSGRAREQQTPLNVCMKSSSGGSKRRPCCRRRTPLRCCSGLCSRPARS